MPRCAIHGSQVGFRWSINTDALAAEPTPMYWAIPALFRLVPAQDPFHMGTNSAELIRLSVSILVDSHWFRGETVMEHAAGVGPEIFNILDIGLQVALVLCVNLDIVLQHAWQGLGNAAHTTGLVEESPRVLDAPDLVRQ